MGGRASLIMVIGFAVIFGIINLNIAKLTTRSVGGMIGYNESSTARLVASSGANVGMAMFTSKSAIRGTIAQKNFTTGPYAGSGYTVTLTDVNATAHAPAYLRLRSVSRCTTFVKKGGAPLVLADTVEVNMSKTTDKSFSTLGWMTIVEGNVFFISGDTLWGQVHSNGNIHVDGSPVFRGKVTTSGLIDPKKNDAKFLWGKPETKVPERPFPDNINEARDAATNTAPSKTTEIWVTLKPGTSSDNDGYAIIRTGSFSGTRVDSMTLSDATDKVIYSTGTVHVKGTLDGRLSIASGSDIKIEGNTVYEHAPNPDVDIANHSVNNTEDMLGLIADHSVLISDDYNGAPSGGININASIFARTGSFEVENVENRGPEGRIRLIGSIAQKTRGVVGKFSGSTVTKGYYKSYRYDNRMWPEGDGYPADINIDDKHPPAFPGWNTTGPLAIKSWWESNRKPFIVDEYE
jgi:hypothetical protein